MKLLRNISIVLLLLGILSVILIKKRTEEKGPLSDSVTVNIARGKSSQFVARELVANKVISNELLFRLLLKYYNVEEIDF